MSERPSLCQKAMVTCSDRAIAYELYKIVKTMRPAWTEGEVPFLALVATRSEKDPKEMYVLLGDSDRLKFLSDQFKDEKSNFHIALQGEALNCTGVEAILGREEETDGEFIFGEAFMKELDEV